MATEIFLLENPHLPPFRSGASKCSATKWSKEGFLLLLIKHDETKNSWLLAKLQSDLLIAQEYNLTTKSIQWLFWSDCITQSSCHSSQHVCLKVEIESLFFTLETALTISPQGPFYKTYLLHFHQVHLIYMVIILFCVWRSHICYHSFLWSF